jgi:hypothetical protein
MLNNSFQVLGFQIGMLDKSRQCEMKCWFLHEYLDSHIWCSYPII